MRGAAQLCRHGVALGRPTFVATAQLAAGNPKDKPRNPKGRAGNLLASCRWLLRATQPFVARHPHGATPVAAVSTLTCPVCQRAWLSPTHAALAASPCAHMHIHVIVAVQGDVYACLYVATKRFSRAYAPHAALAVSPCAHMTHTCHCGSAR